MNSFHSLFISAGCSSRGRRIEKVATNYISTEPHCQRDHPLSKCIYSITTELTNSASL
uniref:Uncharacterized protein n=1 Tax=Anguilla anguilla TaxID=7936 RepID=A0A0E9REV6_ANGAN